MNLDLEGRFALVCGSSQGIGLAAAGALAELGAEVILLARNAMELERRCAELPRTRQQRHGYAVADFFDLGLLADAANDVVSHHGPIHILINNTGGPPAGAAMDASSDQFRSAFEAHLLANQILTQAVVPGMKQSGYGRIVNIISTSVKQPIPGLGVSNTIRGAVASWAKTLSVELGPFGITVNNVLPGFTKTARLDSLIRTKAERAATTVEAIADAMRSEVPLGRFAEPAEVAQAVAFLASPAAAYISGVNLPVDGGRTLCL
jgi:3-oxoacyl-[acyl-carrier protein] reductase